MIRASIQMAACLSLLVVVAQGQNRLAHYDGTTELFSPSGPYTTTRLAIQRIPGDQACGATRLMEVELLLRDLNTATAETITIEVRRGGTGAILANAPDLTATGLIYASAPIVVPFPGVTPVETITFTFSFPSPGVVLPAPSGTPAGDWYVGVILPPAPTVPADGLQLAASTDLLGVPGEQMDPAKVGYPALFGQAFANRAACASIHVPGGNLAISDNRSWHIIGRYAEDTLQPSAHSPAFTGTGATGLNPNYGYAGIWPHLTRVVAGVPDADDIGFRVLTNQPIGSTCIIAGALLPAPVPFSLGAAAANSAVLCLDPATLIVLAMVLTVTPPAGEPAQSQALFGPYDGAGLNGVGSIYFQAVVLAGNQFQLSTACRVVF